jgi:GNAT superfamily N-acetyltransferase
MECMIAIRKIELPVAGLEVLAGDAQAEGYEFIATLVEEWANGDNRFDGPGEVFCGHLEEGLVMAVGGLSCDPFAGRPDMGRIRKVYVRPAWRGKGIGAALVTHLVNEARKHFSCVRLRAENSGAARLYERLGFLRVESPNATHMLQF